MTTYKPFTQITWSDAYRRTLYSPATAPDGWEAKCDLAYELADMSDLTVEQARVLVDLCASETPIKLTWCIYLRGLHKNEVKTTAVIAKYIMPPTFSPSGLRILSGYIRASYCGFEHNVYLTEIRDAQAYSPDVTYEDVPE